jgi:hypothetical protein
MNNVARKLLSFHSMACLALISFRLEKHDYIPFQLIRAIQALSPDDTILRLAVEHVNCLHLQLQDAPTSGTVHRLLFQLVDEQIDFVQCAMVAFEKCLLWRRGKEPVRMSCDRTS